MSRFRRYEIQRDAGAGFVTVASLTAARDTVYVDSGLQGNRLYRYRITVVWGDEDGEQVLISAPASGGIHHFVGAWSTGTSAAPFLPTRLTVDTEVTRSLRALVTWSHRESLSDSDDELRILQQLSFSGELQVTSTVFARALITVSDGDAFAQSEDYLLSWRLFARLQLTGQYNSDVGDTFNSRRYSVDGTLDLFDRLFGFRNVTVYVRFSDVDQGVSRGSHILSWQQGLRATF